MRLIEPACVASPTKITHRLLRINELARVENLPEACHCTHSKALTRTNCARTYNAMPQARTGNNYAVVRTLVSW